MKMCSGLDLQLSPNSEEGGESGVGSGKGSSGRTFPGELSKEEACLAYLGCFKGSDSEGT